MSRGMDVVNATEILSDGKYADSMSNTALSKSSNLTPPRKEPVPWHVCGIPGV